jgi:hypothetical protein
MKTVAAIWPSMILSVLITAVVAAQTAPPRKDIPAIAKAANGAVVSIVMSDKVGKPIGQGSGFVLRSDGIILTNYHVIAEGISAVAKLPDGAFYVVDGVLASDKVRDLAVIKVHGENFRTITLGNSDRLQVGEEVVAIGNPLSLESTVSNGIISGIRTADSLGGRFLQITTPISPGSSGGPLFNMQGEVVGITTMYLEGGENLNFAIPVNDAKLLLSHRSAKLQNFPDEAEPEETPKKTSENEAFVRFRVISYDRNARVVIVRRGDQLFTTTVLSAQVCNYGGKPAEEFETKKDCTNAPSVAGELVGQDIPSSLEVFTSLGHKFEGYMLTNPEPNGSFLLYEIRRNPVDSSGTYTGDFHNEVWWVEKVESIQP